MFWQYSSQLLHGMLLTLELLVFSLLLGLSLTIAFTAIRLTPYKLLHYPIHAFSFFIRGTPLLVQIFLIYYGLGQFDAVRHSLLWPWLKQPVICAILALGINTSAYSTELFCGALATIDRGQIEAGKALGMSIWKTLYLIIIPQAIRRVLPAYSNEVIMVLQGTSLASTITLVELLGATQNIIAITYANVKFFIIVGAIFLFLNMLIIRFFRWLEWRLMIGK